MTKPGFLSAGGSAVACPGLGTWLAQRYAVLGPWDSALQRSRGGFVGADMIQNLVISKGIYHWIPWIPLDGWETLLLLGSPWLPIFCWEYESIWIPLAPELPPNHWSFVRRLRSQIDWGCDRSDHVPVTPHSVHFRGDIFKRNLWIRFEKASQHSLDPWHGCKREHWVLAAVQGFRQVEFQRCDSMFYCIPLMCRNNC